jgi:predicted  nucleic acid-binding Zn-ribbon protein
MSARDADYLRREVEMLQRKQREQEEAILELMERRERQESRVVELTGALEAAQAVKGEHEAVIQEAWREIDARLARKEARKVDIVPLIDPELLTLYDELRAIKDGVAVGRLAESTCGGCHLHLTAAEQLEARRSDPPRCIHCRRILVP